jgi:uncharacterized protein YajQ (UPF0234 family)
MAAENSFDIVCKVEMQEVTNALDQARREIDTRYDLKGTRNEVKLEKTDITLTSPDEMKLKVRVQAAIQEDQVRVSGKNRDDLQKIIALVKERDLGIALQFTNYRST